MAPPLLAVDALHLIADELLRATKYSYDLEPTSDLLSGALVCKDWAGVFCTVLRRDVVLRGDLQIGRRGWLARPTRHTPLAVQVQCVSYALGTSQASEEGLTRLDSTLKGVKTLEFGVVLDFDFHVRVLMNPGLKVPSDDPVDAHLGTPLTRLDDAFFRRNAFSTPGSEAVACQSGWLLANASKLKNKVVLITGVGGLDSLGGQLAVKLATKYGAKVVVSDSTEEGIVETVLEIHKAGGWATGLAINSNVWAEQLRLFNYTLRCFGQIDAVVSADASISDIPTFLLEESLNMMGQLDPPRLGGLSSDLVGTALTAKLAFHHLCHSTSTDVKAFVSVGPAGSVRTASDPIVQPLHQAGAVSGTKTVVTRFVNAMIPGPADTLKDVSVASIADVVDAIIGASTAQDGKKYVVDEVGVFTLPHQSNIGLGALEAGMSTSTESV